MGEEKKRDRKNREGEKNRRGKEEERGKERSEREGVLFVGYLGIWPIIAEIGKRRRD